ncbi:mannose-1-phosphate guanylyltransferase [Sulfodiicoccus acidiphilus]|uniref:Mannose-1-phosphate guanylyltransferase n=1 Tax=Sulfodiicoccus acidiphilus TaxID=1670455 RepID=A0A348B0W1_9CREN|nr:mannose-1-phosphate guanylyltransferase [Sulfodiicoccus acidiphilus]GGT99345.1 mannose-1-phosphate guanylyltransferase [Sulfodiicoccus acidiphilus]
MDYIIQGLRKGGVDRIYISVRVMAEKIQERYSEEDLIFVREDKPLGDAGPLNLIANKYELGDDVLVVYGDVYSEVDFSRVYEFHKEKDLTATVVGTRVSNPRRYGVLLKDDYVLTEIAEKPSHPKDNLVNAGVYVFKTEVLRKVQARGIGRELLPKLINEGTVGVFEYQGVWADIGVPQDYLELNLKLIRRSYQRGYVSEDALVSKDAKLIPPYFVGRGAKVGAYSKIENSLIGRESKIGDWCRITDSLLMEGVEVGSGSAIAKAILGAGVSLGEWVHVREGSILGDEVNVSEGVLLNSKTIVLPFKEINESIEETGKIVL